MRASVVVLLFGCTHNKQATPPPPSPEDGWSERWASAGSEDRQRHLTAEGERFARAVAAEPEAQRLPIEALNDWVLVDHARSLAYVSGEELLALDLSSGLERWRAPAGGTAARAGMSLVVLDGYAASQLTFIDPDHRGAVHPCGQVVAVPPQANVVRLSTFERGPRTYLVWSSSVSFPPRGRPHPDEDAVARAALGCGVVSIAPDCRAEPAALADFLLSPPRDLGTIAEIQPGDCRFFTPELEMPAVAASQIPPYQKAPGEPQLEIVETRTEEPSSCRTLIERSLEAKDEQRSLLWRHPLAESVDLSRCPPPP